MSFEFVNDETEWNYFFLETEKLEPIVQQGDYSEEFYEISSAQYISLEEYDKMSKTDIDRIRPRHICRYLRGSFVFFHKDSIYNQRVSKYSGEHDKMSSNDFHDAIVKYAQMYHKGKI